MPQYRVSLTSTRTIAAVMPDGHLGKQATFKIQSVENRRIFTYEGHGGGAQFNRRCRLLETVHSVLVESEDTSELEPDVLWLQNIVNKALQRVSEMARNPDSLD